jgi:hypothetical protein
VTKKKARDYWTKTVGDLTAFERTDRGNEIWTRLWFKDQKRYRRQFLCAPIRVRGKIDTTLENAAVTKLIERERDLAATTDADDTTIAKGPLTLSKARQMILHADTGKWAKESEWKKAVKTHLDIAIPIIGAARTPESLRHADYRRLWRTLIRTHLTDSIYGLRSIEMIVGSFRSMIVWLQMEGHVEAGIGQPAQGWKQSMIQDWTETTDKPPKEPKQPRYSRAEEKRMWAARPKVDPRLGMLIELGAELRIGQVRRGRRSDIFAHGGHAIGGVVIHGRGKKRGETFFFTDRQRAYVEAAMRDGYLSDLEDAYQAGTIEDYYLAPGEFLARGKAQLKNANALISKKGLTKWWLSLEQAAVVEHVKGRLWYGERRRRLQDIEKDKDASPTAKNRTSGHSHTQTREIYVGKMDDVFREESKDLRERTRPDADETQELTPDSDTNKLKAV